MVVGVRVGQGLGSWGWGGVAVGVMVEEVVVARVSEGVVGVVVVGGGNLTSLREFVENSRHPKTSARVWEGLNCGS